MEKNQRLYSDLLREKGCIHSVPHHYQRLRGEASNRPRQRKCDNQQDTVHVAAHLQSQSTDYINSSRRTYASQNCTQRNSSR